MSARTDPRQQFIEAMAAFMEQHSRMTRMAGRVWATLSATCTSEMIAEDLMRSLGANLGLGQYRRPYARTCRYHPAQQPSWRPEESPQYPVVELNLQESPDFMVLILSEYTTLIERWLNRPQKGEKR